MSGPGKWSETGTGGTGRKSLWTRCSTAVVCVAVVLLVGGCLSLTNHNQSCNSSGGLGSASKFSCSGTAGTVQGEGPLTFDGDDDSDPDYRMDFTASVGSGKMDINAETADGGREGGEVSPGKPVRIEAVVPSSDEEVSVTVSVKGGEEAEARGLNYKANFTETN